MSQPHERVVLITGGAAGIGSRMARTFVAAGDNVHVCDRSASAIDALVNEVPSISATVADVSSASDADRVYADLVRHHGRLDILINNAGIAGPTAAVEDVTDADWDRCIAVDLSGTFYMTRRAVPMLQKSAAGSIINIASTAALFGYPLRSPYAASKWGMIGLTKTWAMELGPDGIRVNAICPGSVKGERIDAVIKRDAESRGASPESTRERYLRQTSMRTFVTGDDIAAMALFLASADAKRVSGQVIAVDGNTESLSNSM